MGRHLETGFDMRSNMDRMWIGAGALVCGLGVALGAFGAHGLESAVTEWYSDIADQQRRLEQWETGVRYQLVHGLALLSIGGLALVRPHRLLGLSAICFVAGTLIFSGMLYAIVLTGISKLGMIVPIGGLLLIVGWALLVAYACVSRSENA